MPPKLPSRKIRSDVEMGQLEFDDWFATAGGTDARRPLNEAFPMDEISLRKNRRFFGAKANEPRLSARHVRCCR